jgi:D-alanyl-D-alanine carboxypeptidase
VTYGETARTARGIRIRRLRVAGLLVVIAALAVAFGDQWPASPSSTASSTATPAPLLPGHGPAGMPDRSGMPDRTLGEADGAIPSGTTVVDDGVPGVANLDPDLLGALRRAAEDAGHDGVGFVVDSGWRSKAYQEHLLQQAVQKYGSEAEASRWVATPDTSEHVSGHAVDLKPGAATAWLSLQGARYGLCQIYDNEPWHYERRPEATEHGCPARYPDAAHDPRMHQ